MNLGYILAEIKTNLDKTMFQEASVTAREVKQAIPGAKYYLDMIPISTATTDIYEILITRKAKRINARIRKRYSSHEGGRDNREEYTAFLYEHPYSTDIFRRFVTHIILNMSNKELAEEDVLNAGYF